jgi:hypothetical protein
MTTEPFGMFLIKDEDVPQISNFFITQWKKPRIENESPSGRDVARIQSNKLQHARTQRNVIQE